MGKLLLRYSREERVEDTLKTFISYPQIPGELYPSLGSLMTTLQGIGSLPGHFHSNPTTLSVRIYARVNWINNNRWIGDRNERTNGLNRTDRMAWGGFGIWSRCGTRRTDLKNYLQIDRIWNNLQTFRFCPITRLAGLWAYEGTEISTGCRSIEASAARWQKSDRQSFRRLKELQGVLALETITSLLKGDPFHPLFPAVCISVPVGTFRKLVAQLFSCRSGRCLLIRSPELFYFVRLLSLRADRCWAIYLNLPEIQSRTSFRVFLQGRHIAS